MATKLEKLEVDRADGVKSPATQRKFLILKTEDPEELRQNFEEFVDEVHGFMVALQKESDFTPSEELATQAASIGEKLAIEKAGNFKKKKPTATEEEDMEPVCSCKGKKGKKAMAKAEAAEEEDGEEELSLTDVAEVLQKSIAKGFSTLTSTIAKASKEEPEEENQEPDDEDDSDEVWDDDKEEEKKTKGKPVVSKQAEVEPVKKNGLRMGVSFADVVCGRRGRK